MLCKNICLLSLPVVFILIGWGLMIGTLSWMQHQKKTGGWREIFLRSQTSGDTIKLGHLLNSWQRQPFVDIAVTSDLSCPADYPEDVIYQIWMGTRGMCECFQRSGNRIYTLNQLCERNENPENKSEDCHDVGGLAPIVQNRIQGIRYCGKRGATSLQETVRPVPIASEDQGANGRKYQCPKGYEACNDAWFDKPDGAEFVVCKPVGDQDFQCPITSIQFDVTDAERDQFKYEWKGDSQNRGVWVSRNVMQHSIEKISLQPNQPCVDERYYSASPNQQFYFAELQRDFRICAKEDQQYQKLSSKQSDYSEWDLQEENGVLETLEQAVGITHSFWPSTVSKKQVKMNFYSKPMSGYKLECANTQGQSISDLDAALNIDLSSEEGSKWKEFQASQEHLPVILLIIVVIVPIASGPATLGCTPAVFIAVSGCFVKLLTLTYSTADELEGLAESQKMPAWLNDCLEGDLQLDFSNFDSDKAQLLTVASDLRSISALMIIVIVQTFLIVVGIIAGIIAVLWDCVQVDDDFFKA